MLAVERDLRAFDQRKAGLSKTAQAALALRLAELIDDPEHPASARASCARVLLATLDELRAQTPLQVQPVTDKDDDKETDQVADIAAKRAERLQGSGKKGKR